jgi:hypothetical protein
VGNRCEFMLAHIAGTGSNQTGVIHAETPLARLVTVTNRCQNRQRNETIQKRACLPLLTTTVERTSFDRCVSHTHGLTEISRRSFCHWSTGWTAGTLSHLMRNKLSSFLCDKSTSMGWSKYCRQVERITGKGFLGKFADEMAMRC